HQNIITKHEVIGIFLGLSPSSLITNNTYAENGGLAFVELDQSPDCIIDGNKEINISGSDPSDEKQISGYHGFVLFLPISVFILASQCNKRKMYQSH
ncbi:MAG: hypothetical protein KAR20_27775, partial [Candidatus Heimdallarchaeota archaeon]|nr:hypothetical protein [Candidatus Heimdallarchaeota archaeon]